ncbi:MAG: hypothetical protein M9894_26425 [Planctomycetes bacterium]|nr:hypothetical protein [Planctomycetota bacterium]
MAWTCQTCGAEVGQDDLTCATCAAPKTSWTVVQDRTRTFRLSGRRVQVLRGHDLADADRAPVLPRAAAQRLADEDRLPRPDDVLVVRLHPAGHADWTVALTVEYAAAEADERALPVEAPAGLERDGHHDVRLLLVHGPGSGPDALVGVDHVVDVTEEDGFAPSIEVAALRKPPRRLPTAAAAPGRYLLNARFFDRTGRVPQRDLECRALGRPARTDGDGHLRVDAVGPGRHLVEFADGAVDVPASHHEAYVVCVRLPFRAATPEEEAAHDPPPGHGEAGDDAPPAWLPVADDDAPPPPDEEADEVAPPEDYEQTHGDPDAPPGDYLLNARLFDASGRVPLGEVECEVDGRALRTDPDGLLRQGGVGPGRHRVRVAGGEVDVPASHHPDCVVSVRVPHRRATEAELDAHALPAGAAAADDDDAPPAWLPVDPTEAPPPAEPDEEAAPVPAAVYEAVHGDVDDPTSPRGEV